MMVLCRAAGWTAGAHFSHMFTLCDLFLSCTGFSVAHNLHKLKTIRRTSKWAQLLLRLT